MSADNGGTTIGWYRTPIERSVLRELTRRSDARGLVQSLGHLGILAVTGTAALYSLGRWPAVVTVLIVYLHGMVFAFLGAGFHELCHGTPFRTRALNEVFLRIYAFLTWNNHHLFRASHMRHHLYTLHPPDDLEVTVPARYRARDIVLRTIVNPLGLIEILYRQVRTTLGRLEGEWEHRIFPESDPAARRRLAGWATTLLAGHIALTAVSIVLGAWLVPVLTTFAMFYGGTVRFFCNMTQHVGLKDNVSDFRLNSRTFEANPVIRFLDWQMNYHIEHHMYAAVPFFNMRRLHRMVEHDLPPTPRGLVATWRQIFAIMHRQDVDPTYQFDAPLPGTR